MFLWKIFNGVCNVVFGYLRVLLIHVLPKIQVKNS